MRSGSVDSARGSHLAEGGVLRAGRTEANALKAQLHEFRGLFLPLDRPRFKEMGSKAPLSMGVVCRECGHPESAAGSRP